MRVSMSFRPNISATRWAVRPRAGRFRPQMARRPPRGLSTPHSGRDTAARGPQFPQCQPWQRGHQRVEGHLTGAAPLSRDSALHAGFHGGAGCALGGVNRLPSLRPLPPPVLPSLGHGLPDGPGDAAGPTAAVRCVTGPYDVLHFEVRLRLPIVVPCRLAVPKPAR